MSIPSEWQTAIQFLVARFTSTEIYADSKFRECELDDILPTWRNRYALFEFLEQRKAIGPKRAGLYTVVLPDLPYKKLNKHGIEVELLKTNRVQLPMSLELRDILPGILELMAAESPAVTEPAADQTPVSAKRLADFVPCHARTVSDALKMLRPCVEGRGRNGGHQWRYSEAVAVLKDIQTGKLAGVNWPDSENRLIPQKDSSKIPARSLKR